MWKIAVRIIAAVVAVALIYPFRSGPLSTTTLWSLGAVIFVLMGYMLFAGRVSKRAEDRRLVDVRRGLDCFLGALAWVLLAAPFLRALFADDSYAGAAITVIPLVPLVLLGGFFLVRTLSTGLFSNSK
jgi:hypothetical protein